MLGRLSSDVLIVLVASLVLSGGVGSLSAQDAKPIPVARGRLVGVYDETTGQPIAGVQVTDIQNGLSVETTETGTLSLFFVDTAGSMVRFRKVGYTPLVMAVANSPRDTTPLTILLHPAGVQLPTVVTTGHSNMRGPADTVRKLDLAGFYDRKTTSGAPTSSFVTAEKIEKLTLVSDLEVLTGRPICYGNLYIDGVRILPASVTAMKGARNLTRRNVDQLLGPGAVLAVETYRVSDVPQQYNATMDPRASPCGATLIWTK